MSLRVNFVFNQVRFISNLILFFFLFTIVKANEKVASDPSLKENSKEVSVTLLIDEITNVSISSGNFKIVSELLFAWEDSTQAGNKIKIIDLTDREEKTVDDIWYPKFSIVNEEIPREILIKILTIYPDGKIELYEKFGSVLAMDTDIKQYPFGSLDLMIEIAAYSQTLEELYFKPTKFLLGHDNEEKGNLLKGNWTIDDSYFLETQKKSINFRGKEFSHNEYHFKIHHDYTDSVQKILAPILIVIIISLFINQFCRMRFSENADFNINGQLVLLLTLVALRFSLGDELPKTHYLNLTDLLFLSSYLVCTVNLLGSIVLQSYYQNKSSKYSEIIEQRFVGVSIFLAIGLILGSIVITM